MRGPRARVRANLGDVSYWLNVYVAFIDYEMFPGKVYDKVGNMAERLADCPRATPNVMQLDWGFSDREPTDVEVFHRLNKAACHEEAIQRVFQRFPSIEPVVNIALVHDLENCRNEFLLLAEVLIHRWGVRVRSDVVEYFRLLGAWYFPSEISLSFLPNLSELFPR